jgi:hypothetical protein
MILHFLMWLSFGKQRRSVTGIEFALVAGIAVSFMIVGVGLAALAYNL